MSYRVTEHTAGPWLVVGPHFGHWTVRQNPENWNGMGYQHICSVPADKKDTPGGVMHRANAHLIAAAPDLLRCLEVVLADATLEPDMEVMVRAAIDGAIYD